MPPLIRLAPIAAALVVAANTAAAQSPYPRIPVPPQAWQKADPSFGAAIQRLTTIIQQRDIAALGAMLSPGYYHDRDFGMVFDHAKKPIENPTTIMELDDSQLPAEFKGTGWNRLAALAGARSFEVVQHHATGAFNVCGPAQAPQAAVQLMEQADPDALPYNWSIVAGSDVIVRGGPDGSSSPAIDSLSFEAVVIEEWGEYDTAPVKIRLPSGASGYIAPKFLVSLTSEQLCFAKNIDGAWIIAGTAGGGD